MDPLLAKGNAESAKHCVVEALDIYELFHMVLRQTSRAAKDSRVPFSKYADGAAAAKEEDHCKDAEDEDEADEDGDKDETPPP